METRIHPNATDTPNEKTTRRRRGWLGCLGHGAIDLLGILLVLSVVGAIYQSAASAADQKKYPAPGKLYDLGGYQLHLYCTGQGSPTVILEAGAANPALAWYFVQADVARFTRVCSYDRPGFGWSDPMSTPVSRDQVAARLHQLLGVAGVPGPYVLAGHSAGGEYIRAFAELYPSEVLGMVFVDSSHESQALRYPAKFLSLSRRQLTVIKACEFLSPLGVIRATRLWHALLPKVLVLSDMGAPALSAMYRTPYCHAAAEEELSLASPGQPGEPGSLGDRPLVVISAGVLYDGAPSAMGGSAVLAQAIRVHSELQQELVSLSSRGQLILAPYSGHNIHWDQPEIVVEAIQQVVEQLRTE